MNHLLTLIPPNLSSFSVVAGMVGNFAAITGKRMHRSCPNLCSIAAAATTNVGTSCIAGFSIPAVDDAHY